MTVGETLRYSLTMTDTTTTPREQAQERYNLLEAIRARERCVRHD